MECRQNDLFYRFDAIELSVISYPNSRWSKCRFSELPSIRLGGARFHPGGRCKTRICSRLNAAHLFLCQIFYYSTSKWPFSHLKLVPSPNHIVCTLGNGAVLKNLVYLYGDSI